MSCYCPATPISVWPVVLPSVLVFVVVMALMILLVCVQIRRRNAFYAAASRAAQPVHLQTFPPAAGEALLLTI